LSIKEEQLQVLLGIKNSIKSLEREEKEEKEVIQELEIQLIEEINHKLSCFVQGSIDSIVSENASFKSNFQNIKNSCEASLDLIVSECIYNCKDENEATSLEKGSARRDNSYRRKSSKRQLFTRKFQERKENIYKDAMRFKESGDNEAYFQILKKGAERYGYVECMFLLGTFCLENNEYTAALNWFQTARRKGCIKSIHSIGLMFEAGMGTELPNPRKSFQYYSESAKQGYSKAMYDLGRSFHYGIGVSENFKSAIYWYKKAVATEDSRAMLALGQCFEHGKIIRQDQKRALDLYKSAYELGNDQAQIFLGRFFLSGKNKTPDYNRALKYFRRAHERGDNEGTFHLANMYFNGHGMSTDVEKAAHLYESAALQGHAASMVMFAKCLRDGTGVMQNPDSSVKWFRRSCELNCSEGSLELGRCYLKSYGLNCDYSKAVSLFETAAIQGNSDAMVELANCFEKGIGVELSIDKMLENLKMAADNDNICALIKLAEIYRNGRYNIPRSEKRTTKYIERAIQMNSCEAKAIKAEILLENISFTTQHSLTIFRLFQEAAAEHVTKAYKGLITCYTRGIGTPVDLTKARFYYNLSIQTSDAG
jgi:TPR repeat protein